jgi:hypothetical protein
MVGCKDSVDVADKKLPLIKLNGKMRNLLIFSAFPKENI